MVVFFFFLELLSWSSSSPGPVVQFMGTDLDESQHFEAGSLAWREPEFKAFFQGNYIASRLRMGDAVFFNPAVFCKLPPRSAGQWRGSPGPYGRIC